MNDEAPGSRPSWFSVADAVGDELVPERADWVLLHIRSSVVAAMRAGVTAPLADAGLGDPVVGEPLELISLRHSEGDLEVVLRDVVMRLAPRVGDPFGSGRVTATGQSRVATRVDPQHLRAIARDEKDIPALEALDLGSAVIVPVVSDGIVLGALNVVRAASSTLFGEDLAVTEALGRRVGEALDASRPATAQLARQPPRDRSAATATYVPSPAQAEPGSAVRRWVRRTLPELLEGPVRHGLLDDLDLVLSELAGNADRHAGGVRRVVLERKGAVLRVVVADDDDRTPTLRALVDDEDPLEALPESGRGMALVAALSERWGVRHPLPDRGKAVWADLPLRD